MNLQAAEAFKVSSLGASSLMAGWRWSSTKDALLQAQSREGGGICFRPSGGASKQETAFLAGARGGGTTKTRSKIVHGPYLSVAMVDTNAFLLSG